MTSSPEAVLETCGETTLYYFICQPSVAILKQAKCLTERDKIIDKKKRKRDAR